METETSIYFWSNRGKYAYLSNFHGTSFEDSQGVTYLFSEQYFMKRKQEMFDPLNDELAKKIMMSTSPNVIKACGRKVMNFNDEVWSRERYGVMLEALTLKFSQNEALAKKLLLTGEKSLFEASPNDRVWGIGYAAKKLPPSMADYGSNLLGLALMEVRRGLQLQAGEPQDGQR